MAASDSASECDCAHLSVHSFVNHRGEFMRSRPARPVTRRTRGLGEVRSVRSRSSDHTSDLPSDNGSVRSVPPATLHRSRSSHVLQYNGELFVPVRAVAPGPTSRPDSAQATATQPAHASNLPDYLFYSLRTQPSAGEQTPNPEPACPACVQLRARLARLEKELGAARAENNSLGEQLKAARRGRLALERNSLSEFGETLHAENEALREEAATLRRLATSAGGDKSHTGAVAELREMLGAYIDEERKQGEGKLGAARETLAEIQEALIEERKGRREDVGIVEARLIADKAALTAHNAEIQHQARLGDQRREQLAQQLAEMQERVQELNATLGQTPGILPELSDEEQEILLGPWAELPPEVTECMDSPAVLQRLVAAEDGLEDKDEMIRCLWYRAKVSAKALHALQSRLASLGLTSTDQLGELSEVSRQLWEKDQRLRELELALSASTEGQAALARQHRDDLGALVAERNDALTRLDTAAAQTHLLQAERHGESDSAPRLHSALLQKLSEVYDGADCRDKAQLLAEENALLRVGRAPDEGPASIHEVLRLTDPAELRERCVALANERDAFLVELRGERERNSDERRVEHVSSLERELAQSAEDRRELRQQVAHFSGQLGEALNKHEEQMAERERELTVLRLKLQEMSGERDEVRLEWEKERRNANDLKVTFHKEIKSQSQAAEEMRRELDLALRQLRAAQAERDSLLDEVKLAGSAAKERQRSLVSALERCDGVLQTVDQEEAREARRLLSGLRASPVEEEIVAVTAAPQMADNQVRSSAQMTDQVSSDLLGKLTACVATPTSDQISELRAGVLDMTAKFDVERRAWRSQLQQVLVDLRSAQSRLKAAEETKAQLEAACAAFDKKLAAVREDLGGKALKEENNRLLAAAAAADKGLTSLRARVDQLRREKKELRRSVALGEERATELRAAADRLRVERDDAQAGLRKALGERDRLRDSLTAEQERAGVRETQLRMLGERSETQHAEARERNAEVATLREALFAAETEATSARQEAATGKEEARAEATAREKAVQARRALEGEIQSLKAQLLEAGDGDSVADVARKIVELKETVSELQRAVTAKDSNSQDLQAQLEAVIARLDETEAELAQERSLLVVAKTRNDALEDENEWLRTQNAALSRRATTPRTDRSDMSRGELINQMILRSHSKAQAALASRARSVTPNGITSPCSEVTEHMPFFLNHSLDL